MLLLPLQLSPGSPVVEAPESVGPFALGPHFQAVLKDVQHQMASGASPPDPAPPSLAAFMARLLTQTEAPPESGDTSALATTPTVLPDDLPVILPETPSAEHGEAFQSSASATLGGHCLPALNAEGSQEAILSEDRPLLTFASATSQGAIPPESTPRPVVAPDSSVSQARQIPEGASTGTNHPVVTGHPVAYSSGESGVASQMPLVSDASAQEGVETSTPRPTAGPVEPGVRVERPVTAPRGNAANTETLQTSSGAAVDSQARGEGSMQDSPDRESRAPVMSTRSGAQPSQTPFDSLKQPQMVAETPVVDESTSVESRMPEGVSVRPDVRVDVATNANRIATDTPSTLPDDATPDQIERTYRVTDQIIRSARVLNREGNHQVTMRLDPPELGQVTIRLSSQDQVVSGEIAVENQKVHDIVTRHLGSLREALNGQGVQLDQIDVSVQDRGAQADRETFREALDDRSGGAQDGRRERQRSSEQWTPPEPQQPSDANEGVDFMA